jgi:MFS family permease
MLITGWVSTRIGAKRTLLAGLVLIVVFSALAGASSSIGQIFGFRAGWTRERAVHRGQRLLRVAEQSQAAELAQPGRDFDAADEQALAEELSSAT